jgi:serine/threonine protein kinase
MAKEPISELLLRWEELRDQGQNVAAEELCCESPELLEEVRRRMKILEAMSRIPNGVNANLLTQDEAPGHASPEYPALAGYEILEELGRGGMGVVYKARQVQLKRLVALKRILTGPQAGKHEVNRFRAEAEAVARLQHPNIVQIYEVHEQNGCPYLALEFVDGVSLAQKLDGTPWPARQAAQLMLTLARAVHYAHQRGIVHRDLKPANILLQGARGQGPGPREEGVREEASVLSSLAPRPSPLASSSGPLLPKITDFGLAKRLDVEMGQTQTGAILGTPSYMAPEQAEGKPQAIGPKTDVYALGAILYELLTGRPPFQGAALLETLEQVRSQDPAPLRSLQPRLPRDLETICLKCLEKQPEQRYASAEALADDLQRFLDGDSIHARRSNLLEQLKRALDRRPDASLVPTWSGMVRRVVPIPLLCQAVPWLLWRGEPAYPLAAVCAVPVTALVGLSLVVLGDRALWSRSANSVERQLLTVRIGLLTGMSLVLVVCWLMATPEHPLNLLGLFPLWAVMAGTTFFGLASRFWGRLYLIALAYFATAILMAWQLIWAPLLFGTLLSLMLLFLSYHLRQQERDRAEAVGGTAMNLRRTGSTRSFL